MAAQAWRWFEYHCLESEESAHAEVWHHTDQPVRVLAIAERGVGVNAEERLEINGQPRVYSVQWLDGFTHGAFEDELSKEKGA